MQYPSGDSCFDPDDRWARAAFGRMTPSDLPNRATFKTITEPSILVTPAMPLLSEPQTLAIINATRPLQEHERVAFLTALLTLLAGRLEIGDGELGRMLARLQRDHFQPPTDVEIGTAQTAHQGFRLRLTASYARTSAIG